MAYGILKCDTITFTSDGVDKSVAISGLVQNPTFTGNVTVTGTISGNTVRGQTISGVTVTGTTAQFTSGTFASLTGVTVTGTTANFTSGNFTNISGGTHTITSGVFASGTAANPSISFVSDPNSGLYSPGADQVAISTSGTGRLFINATGQVGIGGSPSSNFEITSALPTARLRDTTDNSYAEILNNNGALSLRADEGNVASASYIDIRVDGSERARFTSDGRLGLGTSSPATPIEVVGASTTDTEENYALFRGPGTSQPGVYIGGNSTTASTGATARYGYVRSQSLGGTARALYLQTGTDTRVVIDNTGKVGIGTTSPVNLLHVQGDATFEQNAGGQFAIRGSTNTANRLNFGFETTNNYAWIQSITAGTAFRPIALNPSGGNVGIGTTSPGHALHVSNGNDSASGEFVGITIGGTNSANARTGSIIKDTTTFDLIYKNQNFSSALGAHVFRNGPSEHARIDSSGRLLVGTSNARTNFRNSTISAQLQVESTTTSLSSAALIANGSASSANPYPNLFLARSRGALGTNVVVAANDILGGVSYQGNDGSEFVEAGLITCEVDGTPGANDMPGRLVFSTTLDGASSPTERMRITSAGNVGIGTTGPQSLLHVQQSADGEIFRLQRAGGTNIPILRVNLTDSTKTAEFEYTGSDANGNIAFKSGGSERARIDSSGRLLVGTSSALAAGGSTPHVQLVGDAGVAWQSIIRTNATTAGSNLVLGQTRGSIASRTIAQNNDVLSNILFVADDGIDLNTIAASIKAEVDGTPGANDMPGRLVFFTTADGASSPTERFRITNDGVKAYDQPAPAAVNATATLTVANLKTGIITSTSALATDMTLPTGTDTQAGFNGTYDNFTFEWSVINTGLSLVRVLAGTAHTIVGSGSVVTGTSGRFASRRTAANTFVTYRLS
jgi:hypothetical protein